MSFQLSDDDRRAVDLLLDRSPTASGNGNSHALFAAADGVPQERIRGVEKILQVLEMMPPAEPPVDLLARTLQRLDEPAGSLGPEIGPLIDAQRPIM